MLSMLTLGSIEAELLDLTKSGCESAAIVGELQYRASITYHISHSLCVAINSCRLIFDIHNLCYTFMIFMFSILKTSMQS